MKTLSVSVVGFAVLCGPVRAQQQGIMPETVAKELAFFVEIGPWKKTSQARH